ncbi:MAG: pteridine reductase [Gammaproteobacteria bacterium]
MSEHKVALITGAAKRIGAACGRMLHHNGYDLLLHYQTSSDEAADLAAELNALRTNSVRLFQADLLSQSELQHLIDVILSSASRIDVVINNASLFYPGRIGSVTEADWNNLLGVNLKAPFFLTQALAPALAERKGSVVNIVDIHAEKGLLGYPVYSIAKAGLVAMTKCLAKELAPHVRVNAVAPGAILWPDQPISETNKEEILQRVALRRCGNVEDVARAVHFLVDDADYITGHVLTVDGGRTLFS